MGIGMDCKTITMNQTVIMPSTFSMAAYTGPWTSAEASHLLRRTMFGPTYQQIQSAVANGLSATVNSLLTIPTIGDPLTISTNETVAAQGTTWINSAYPTSGNLNSVDGARAQSLRGWMLERINKEQFSIAEKMCLFWQNHFAASESYDARANYNYHMLLRNHALGDFKQLIKDITIDPNMLVFLNGRSNSDTNPNENYSRELLELYTIGKGPQVGPGDYTNYTETDVAEGAKILTGWTITGMRSTTVTAPYGTFVLNRHDTTTKTLSARFGNATIASNGAQEYEDYIDIIFQQPAVASFICQKLYRYFVNYDLTQDVLNNVIPVMAQTLISNNYSILPVMQELLMSEHFYDIALRGSIIRGHLETIFGMLNPTSSVPAYDLNTDYTFWQRFNSSSMDMGQEYMNPPNVAGWTAYYQQPSFSRLWIDTSTLKKRFDFSSRYTTMNGLTINLNKFKIRALNFVDSLSLPSDAVAVIDDICLVFFPRAVDQSIKDELRAILTNNLPDFEWTTEYGDYIANPGNQTYADAVRIRVEKVLARVFTLPHFHTI